jgi:hypothetical protein
VAAQTKPTQTYGCLNFNRILEIVKFLQQKEFQEAMDQFQNIPSTANLVCATNTDKWVNLCLS